MFSLNSLLKSIMGFGLLGLQADNVDITPGTGATVAADLIAAALHQRVKITLGADGTNDGDVASGNPMPVTGTITAVTGITNALPAGTNAIGKLAANDGIDIGNVDVASCALPTGAATSAKQLADGHNVVVSSGTITTVSTLTDQTKMNGQTISMGTGTRDAGTQRVTIATNDAVPVTFTDQKIDLNKVAGASVAVDNGTAATSIRVTVASDSTGQVKLAAGTALIGKVGIDQATANANEVVVKSGTVTAVTSITNAVAVTNAGITTIAGAVSGTKMLVTADAITGTVTANAGTNLNTSALATESGGNLAAAATSLAIIDDWDSSDHCNIRHLNTTDDAVAIADGGNTITVDNGGTFAVQGTAVGTIADDATTPGSPVMIGGKAVETDGTDPSSVSAEDDVAICRTDRNRRLLVNFAHPNSSSASLQHATAQTDHELVAAPGANLSLYITDIIVSNGATAGDVLFEEDTSSAKTAKITNIYLAANGGFVANLRTPIRCTTNKNFGFTSTTVTTHSVFCTYYIAP